MKIIQHLFQPLQFSLAGRNHISKLRVMCGKNQAKGFAEQSLDPQFITEGFLFKKCIHLVQLFQGFPAPLLFSCKQDTGKGRILQKRPETVAFHITSQISIKKIRSHKDRCIQSTAVICGITAMRDISVQKETFSRMHLIIFLIDLVSGLSQTGQTDLKLIMPVDRDIFSLKHPEIIVIYCHGKGL